MLLFINACPRGEQSRSLRLARRFLASFSDARPEEPIETVDLGKLGLVPYDGKMVDEREGLIGADQLDDARFHLARQLAAADRVVVAAPYWDMMFPAVLKLYIEHIFVRKVTFCYDDNGPVGLCRAKWLAYITTAGSPIAQANLGGEYMEKIAGMLGIPRFEQITCEGLDIVGADVEALMTSAGKRAEDLAYALSGV